jgi:energy-coupling factor transporter ATP-binding protein EcfA2
MISDNRQTEKRIFVSYSHVDKDRWHRLKTQLIPLEREGQISVWCDEDLYPGDEWEKRLEEKISDCDVFLALLSADFIASEPCRKECSVALQEGGQIRIIPVLLRECAWEKAGLEPFQMITDDGRPLMKTDDDLDRAGTLLARKLAAYFPTSPKVPRQSPHQDPRPEVSLRDFARALLSLQKGAPGAVERYIDLTLTNLEGEQQTWERALEDSEHRSHLVYADSGCGKTTLLKHIAFELLKDGKLSDGLIPLYIHLENLVDATLEQALQTKLLSHKQYTAEWLLWQLRQFQIEKKVIYLLDGYDQVDGNRAVKNVDTGDCIKVVATRKLPDATLAAWANSGYKVWKLDPVSPRQVDDYIGTGAKATAAWFHRLREERLTREMLRIPLFLEMLSRVVPKGRVRNNNLTAAWIIERYWDWQVNQENQARSEVSDLHELNDEQWAWIHDCASDCAWRLALEGYIETFTGPFAGRTAHAVSILLGAIQKAGLRNFDFVSIHAQGGHFRHQALQAYLAARAIAVELRTDQGGPTPIRDAILDALAFRFPERLIPGREPDPQLSFWLEAFGLVPGILRELYRIRDNQVMEDDWDSAVWILARDLIRRGLFLLAWRMVMRAEEETNTASSGDGWREILWQLVRYRRDSEDHFPKESARWHYDPLAQAIIALDGLVVKGQDRLLREGLTYAFHELEGLFTQKLGAYELMVCYLDWSGSPSDIDDYRVAFLLGEADGCKKGYIRISQPVNHVDTAGL